MDTSYVAGIETGKRSPSIYCLYQIAIALNVSLKDIADFIIEE
ncbi:helix-turn-helix transcriptional regulator [bacterium]|nr:helix-turn-helix transcriptional regulator [bacterium]